MGRLLLVIAAGLLALSIGCSSKDKKSDNGTATTEAGVKAGKAEAGKAVDKAKADMKKGMDDGLVCANGKDKRSLEIRPAGSGCEVVYTKFEQENVIASGSTGKGYCEQTVEKVKSNLENAGFSCN